MQKEVKDELVDVLTDTKIGMSTAEARAIAAKLRQALPTNLPRTVDGLKQTIRDLMDAATKQARAEGLTNQGGKNALGNRAHRYTEYLLDQLNLRFAGSGMKIGVFAEQFRAPRKRGDWILSQNKKDWLGVDAVVYADGKAVFGIDLKTGRTWSKGELELILRRFGFAPNELETHHPR